MSQKTSVRAYFLVKQNRDYTIHETSMTTLLNKCSSENNWAFTWAVNWAFVEILKAWPTKVKYVNETISLLSKLKTNLSRIPLVITY